MSPRIEQAEIERAKRKPTGSLDAYDYFLHGMATDYGWTRQANNEALRLFHKAIENRSRFCIGLRHGCVLLLPSQGASMDGRLGGS